MRYLYLFIIIFLTACAHTHNVPTECVDPVDCPQLDPGFYDELKKAALSIPIGIGVAFIMILLFL